MLVSKILEATLTAGNTSVTFTDTAIPNSLIRVYANDPDHMYLSATVTGNSITITYTAQDSNKSIALEIVKAGLEVVDNLTSSTDASNALSAKQGYVLKGLIDDIVIPTVPESIGDLDDVDLTGIQDNDVLIYDSDEEMFLPGTITGSNGENYSLTEVKIGSWFGQDLFQKSFKFENISLSSGKNIVKTTSELSSLNISRVVNTVEGCISLSSGTYNINLPYAIGSTSYVTADYDSNEGIRVFRGGSTLSVYDMYLTIKYIKTT